MNFLSTLAQCLGVGAAFMLALWYLGFGATRLLLPPEYGAWRAWVTPFVGLALVVVWDYIALFFGINLTLATYGLVALATLVNAGIILRAREGFRALRLTRPAQSGPLVLALCTFALGIAPLLRFGYVTIIGENWDYEFYLPLADYLKTSTVEQLAHAPSNPLLLIVTNKFIGRLPMGFSYLHATMDVLWGLTALDSYAILIALLRALGILSAFVFYRLTLKMSARAALFASALYAASGLLLWTTDWGFGLQLASLALLPLTITFCAHALGTRQVRAVPLAALLLAALNVTFHPTLIAALLPLGPLGLYFLFFQKDRVKTLSVGVGLLLLAAALSFPALFHIRDFIREFYILVRLGFGVREFIPFSDGLGLSLYTLDIVVGQTIATPWLFAWATRIWDVTALPLTLVAGALMMLALVRLWPQRECRVVWYLITGAYLSYVLILRLPFLHPYPYGFFKALTLVIFFSAALLAEGLEQLPSLLPGRLTPRRARQLQIGLGAVFVAANLFALGIMLEQYFKPAPHFFNADDLSIRTLPRRLSPGATVLLTDRPEVQKLPMGLVSYALREFPLHGQVQTGYSSMNNAPPGAVYDYALLARGQDPTGLGYQAALLWSNQKFALYAKAPGVVFHRTFNARTVNSDALLFTLGANTVVTGTKTVSSTVATRGVNIALAAFVPQTVNLQLGDHAQKVALTPGLAVVNIPQATLPDRLSITTEFVSGAPGADTSVFMPWIELREASTGDGRSGWPVAPTEALLVRCESATAGGEEAHCSVANPGAAEMRWEYVVRGTPKSTHDEQELIRLSMVGTPRASIETDGESFLRLDNLPSQEFVKKKLPDGNYRAALEIFKGNILVGRIELFKFTLDKGGTVFKREAPSDPPLVIINNPR